MALITNCKCVDISIVLNMKRIICIGLLFISCTLFSQEKRALVIGIGEYLDPEWSHICGDKDIPYVETILDAYGFDDRVILKNDEATKGAIVNAFRDLSARSSAGDVVYIHFSGHGQQMTDVDGDEEDGWDESWVPYDAYRQNCSADDGSRHLSDDEVNSFLLEIRDKVKKNGKIVVVVDACHSGDSARDTEQVLNGEEWPSRGVSNKFIVKGKTKSRKSSAKEDWLTISACESYQRNFEVRKPRVGKLTYCLYQLRKELSTMSNSAIIDAVSDIMEAPDMVSPIPQNPILTGDLDRYEFKDIFL